LLVVYAAIAEHARALLPSDSASLAHLPESQHRHLGVLADLLRGLPELEERHLLGTPGFWQEHPRRQPSEPDELPPDTEAAAAP
jgi:hypothetical protein